MRTVFVLFLVFLIVPHVARAQSYALSVAPHTYHIIIKPGAAATVPLTITNSGDPTIIQLEPYLVQKSPDTGSTELIPYYSDNPTLPRITLGDSEAAISSPFLINTKDSVEADITITVPNNTPAGDYVVAIAAQTVQSAGFTASSAITLQPAVASRIVISVSETGILHTSADVLLFDVSPAYEIPFFGSPLKIVSNTKDMRLTMTMVNTGTNVAQMHGNMGVTANGFAQQSAAYDMPRILLMAGQQRTLTFTKELQRIYFGKVHVDTAIYFDNNPNPISPNVTFYIIPVQLILIFFTMLAIGGAIYVLTKYVKT